MEATEGVFSDDTREMRKFAEKVEGHLKAALNVRANVNLVEPNTIERGAGKAKRIVDRREV